MDDEKEKPTGVVAYCAYVTILFPINFVKRQYLDEEQGNKNPTDRSVLVVRDCSSQR